MKADRELAATIFAKLDTDKDGMISEEEGKLIVLPETMAKLNLEMPWGTVLIHADTNNDNLLSKREYEDWFVDHMEISRLAQKDWKSSDADKDGKLTLEEYLKSSMAKGQGVEEATRLYKSMDRNNDGNVTKPEYEWFTSPNDFAGADRDGDGSLTEEEFLTAPMHFHQQSAFEKRYLTKEFRQADADHDGKVTLEEYNKSIAAAPTHEAESDDADDDDEQYNDKDNHDMSDDRANDEDEWQVDPDPTEGDNSEGSPVDGVDDNEGNGGGTGTAGGIAGTFSDRPAKGPTVESSLAATGEDINGGGPGPAAAEQSLAAADEPTIVTDTLTANEPAVLPVVDAPTSP